MEIRRSLRYGGFATLVIGAGITFVAGFNLLVERLPWRADMTFERFFSLSEQTKNVLGGLEQDVTVLQLWEAGREDGRVVELIQKYQSRSKRIQVRQVDPYRNPVELKKYEEDGTPPGVGSLILEAGGRFRVLRLADMYEMQQDPNTGEQIPTGFAAENAITNAIVSVTALRDPVIYLLRGHGEKELQPLLMDRLERAFYDVRDLTLAIAGGVPDDATMVVVVSPKTDISPAEQEALLSYMRRRGGKLFLMTDIGADPQPNIGKLLESFGLAIRPWLVVEGAADHMLPSQPYVLIPSVGSHPITDPSAAADFPIVFPVSQVIERLTAVRRTVMVQPLLASSDRAYAKVNLEDESGEKGPGDVDGPFALAAAVTDSGEVGEKPSRMVVMGSSHYIFPPETMGRLEENENLFLNGLGWLQDRPELLSIGPRVVPTNRYDLSLSQAQFFLFGGIAVILIPLIIFLAGLITWLRMRHK
jgi:ABC-2 type transport system permease protein